MLEAAHPSSSQRGADRRRSTAMSVAGLLLAVLAVDLLHPLLIPCCGAEAGHAAAHVVPADPTADSGASPQRRPALAAPPSGGHDDGDCCGAACLCHGRTLAFAPGTLPARSDDRATVVPSPLLRPPPGFAEPPFRPPRG